MSLISYVHIRPHIHIAYEEYGDQKGHPVFFFHGWPGSRLQAQKYDHIAQNLHIRLISADRPGYGLSTYQPHRRLLDWPKDVQQLADHLNISKFSVIGVSGGAPYAAATAYALPHRVRKVSIVVGLSPTTIHGVLQGMDLAHKIAFHMYHLCPPLMYMSSAIHFARHKLSKKDTLPAHRAEAYKQGIIPVAKDLDMYVRDWGFDVSDIRQNVSLWYGTQDTYVSLAMGKFYEENIPKSTLHRKDCGHFLLDEYTEEVFKNLLK